jgi:hypothetical protein
MDSRSSNNGISAAYERSPGCLLDAVAFITAPALQCRLVSFKGPRSKRAS